MADAATGAVTAGQLQSGLKALRSAEPLTLLRIADYGARGLIGPEFAEGDPKAYGNFVKLCRLDLYSGKDKTSGGSFGLGKAVYWRFSRLQTVSSIPLFGRKMLSTVSGEIASSESIREWYTNSAATTFKVVGSLAAKKQTVTSPLCGTTKS